MSVRRRALEAVEEACRREGPAGIVTVPASMVFASKLYPPRESWTKAWSWWHEIPTGRLLQSGSVAFACEREDRTRGFHVLLVPTAWMREHERLLHLSRERYSLFLSAESSDRFRDRRGSGLNLSRFLIAKADPELDDS